jgi:16S rRNA (uracil1498-N3)-methyltransferase
MALHRIYLEQPTDLRPGPLALEGEEARHALRVKRLAAGEPLEVLDGRGGVGAARLERAEKSRSQWRLILEVTAVRRVEPTRPRLEVLSPAPKGPRLTELIDGLSQTGAASWSALVTERSGPDPGDTRVDRLRRVAAEASKQCGRAWLLEIGEPRAFPEILGATARPSWGAALPPAAMILADSSGDRYQRTRAGAVLLLIGPEGGCSPRELEAARAAGVALARFGPHTMRIETAAPVAAAIILDAESRGSS